MPSRRTPTPTRPSSPTTRTGAPIISYLQSHGVKAKTFPTTGQDATLTGLQNVLSGYQCGTVYKPIYLEAQAGGRAGVVPPRRQAGAVVAAQRHEDGPDHEDVGAFGAAGAGMGHSDAT